MVPPALGTALYVCAAIDGPALIPKSGVRSGIISRVE